MYETSSGVILYDTLCSSDYIKHASSQIKYMTEVVRQKDACSGYIKNTTLKRNVNSNMHSKIVEKLGKILLSDELQTKIQAKQLPRKTDL